MNKLTQKFIKALFATIVAALLVFAQLPMPVQAAQITNINQLDQARVSFTFDDGFASTRTLAAPILEARGIDGVLYLESGIPDGTSVLDDNQPGITWAQAQELQNVYGWEIGGHTQSHVEMPTVTAAENEAQLTNSNAAFAAHGLNVTNFASPFGAYDNNTITEILKYYKSHRAFQDIGLNTEPYNKAIFVVQDVNDKVTPAQVQAWVDQAIANKQWLILVFHDTQTAVNPNYEYTVTTANLTTMANYVQTKVAAGQIKTVTVEQAITIPGVNVLQNSGFEAGLTNGWNTDNAASVQADSASHGNYGSPVQSVSLTGTATSGHLFSGLTPVSTTSSYVLDTYVNATGITAGELGFYIDEYDVNNNWISGQWLGMVTNGTVGFFTKLYNATSTLVNTIRVQTYLTAGATGTAYVDSTNLYNLDGTPAPTTTVTPTPSETVTPTPTGSVTPTPAAQNVITNGTFDAGLTGWTTSNATNVTANTNVVTFTGTTTATHLFQNLASVDTAATYLLSATADTTSLTSGELGFYIDEYDANANWISGQWLGAVVNGAVSNFQKAYKATSTLVNNIRVQTYVTAGATGSATTDNYSLVNQSVTTAPTGTVTPTPTGSVTPTPTTPVTPGVNLVVNNGFETVSGGFADSWTRDTTDFVIDTASQGNAGTNSLHIPSNTAYAHAFSANITVDPTKTYTWSQYVSNLSGTGELGFYIDEYDAAGNWVSGQWKGLVSGVFTGTKTYTYIPTNATVNHVRLQYYVTPNSTMNAYIDSVSFGN